MTDSRFIPATIATQHPDNAFKPYWGGEPFISSAQEVEECFRCFCDLECDEYMWDWEGKFVDEAVVDRLYLAHLDYFSKNPLGKEKFLTFRVPNIKKEGPARLARAFTGILSASYSAQEMGLHTPPLFEVIHPMTTAAEELIQLQKKFVKTAEFQKKILELETLTPTALEIIPLIEGTGTLLKSRKILEKYLQFMEKRTGKKPTLIRPFIARSDPALDGGFLAAVLSAKAALSEYYRFQRETKIVVKPMIGAGSPHFRGGLSPQTIDSFLELYPGLATVTLQSSFRYDHPQEEVKKGIRRLKDKLSQSSPVLFTLQQMRQLNRMDEILVKHYRSTIEGLEGLINQVAPFIPKRRERIQHVGHFGYSRQIGTKSLNIPRAITFTSLFYSLGIPPEFIGLGRGLKELREEGLLKPLESLYPQLAPTLVEIGRFFNRENLEILARSYPPFTLVQKGIDWLEGYVGERLGPLQLDDFLHRNYSSNVLQHLLAESSPAEDILKAAQIRKSLG